jgi:hypothetical protein
MLRIDAKVSEHVAKANGVSDKYSSRESSGRAKASPGALFGGHPRAGESVRVFEIKPFESAPSGVGT